MVFKKKTVKKVVPVVKKEEPVIGECSNTLSKKHMWVNEVYKVTMDGTKYIPRCYACGLVNDMEVEE